MGLAGSARRGATDSSVWRLLLGQYQIFLSTTLSSGSSLAKRRQFSSSISSHFWRYGAPEIATWGVISTFGILQNGLADGSSSGSAASSAAPASWPDCTE